MKILNKKGSILEFEIEEDLEILVDKNGYWFLDSNYIKAKEIILIIEDQRINPPTTDYDLFIYTSLSHEPFIIKNVNKNDFNFKCSSKTNLLFDINFLDKNILFYFHEKYIVGIHFHYKKNVNNLNQILLSIPYYNQLIKLSNIDSIKKIETKLNFILHIKTLNNEEAFFREVSSYWNIDNNINTGNFSYCFFLENNKKIFLNNKNKINYCFNKDNYQINFKIEDNSIIFGCFNNDVVFIEERKKPFKIDENSINLSSNKPFFVKHI